MHFVHAFTLCPGMPTGIPFAPGMPLGISFPFPFRETGPRTHCRLGFWFCFTVGLYFPLSFECLQIGFLCFPHIAHSCAIGHSVAGLFFFCKECGTISLWSSSFLSSFSY